MPRKDAHLYPPEYAEHAARVLKKHLDDTGMNQTAMGRLLGISQSKISRIISPNPDDPEILNFKAIIKLADLLGCSIDEVIGRQIPRQRGGGSGGGGSGPPPPELPPGDLERIADTLFDRLEKRLKSEPPPPMSERRPTLLPPPSSSPPRPRKRKRPRRGESESGAK